MQYYRVLLHGRYFVIPSFTTRPWSQSGSDSQFASWLTVSLPAADVNICYRSLSLIWNLEVLKFNSNVSVYCSRCCFPNTHWFFFPYYWSLMHNIFLDGELRLFFLTRKKKKKLTDQKSLFAQATWLRRRCHITSVASPQRWCWVFGYVAAWWQSQEVSWKPDVYQGKRDWSDESFMSLCSNPAPSLCASQPSPLVFPSPKIK